MEKSRTIGNLIEEEIGKQQMKIIVFAEKINCRRNNVYDIFKRSSIDTEQLKQISKVLNRNFFSELAEDMDLIRDVEETEEDMMKRKIWAQFFEVVPDVLKKMNRSCNIVLPKIDKEYEDCPVPDFGIPDYNFAFTVGETYRKRLGENRCIDIEDRTNEDGYKVEIVHNKLFNSIVVNIPLERPYSEKEYEDLFRFVFSEYESLFEGKV